jgi:DNA-binding SARP family transcriptional activator
MLRFLANLTEARFAAARGECGVADERLRHAFRIAREQDFVNTPCWRSDQMADACARALAADIEVDYVRSLIARRRLVPPGSLEIDNWPWTLMVRTLQPFAVTRVGEPLRYGRKVQRKPLALLRAVVALGGRDVLEDRIVDALWSASEGDAAHRAFAVTLHRLRKLVDHDDAIAYHDRRVTLDPCHCWVDTWAFERLLDRGDAARRSGRDDEAHSLVERAVELYRQPFLADQPGDLEWAAPLRRRLRARFVRAVVQLADESRQDGRPSDAVRWYERGLSAEPAADEFHRGLAAIRP